MRWKDWKKFPEIDDLRISALRSLVFKEILKSRDFNDVWTVDYVWNNTLITARTVLFFILRKNAPAKWSAIESYLQEKYGYAESTINGYHQHLLSFICDGEEWLRLKDHVYEQAIRILEDEEFANQIIEEAEQLEKEIIEELRKKREEMYSITNKEDDKEEDSESSIRLVLGSGERLRVTVEVEVIIKSIRFHAD
ncbi:hypothetical protein VFC49_09295 [Thermococcus sp. SY098]|uniref:hypothetical protein n=1 Tax=Thermococcus sp. SY098 TaxID=3111325 RepID=UPI002D774E8E|nr:hypothetical protein [Thermococcus sp. SY098]WRS52241.1 hypothetical protein VFC49_09295 [Thermococcus sp. SY098]